MTGRLKGLSSMATRHILAEIAAGYERDTGLKVEIQSMGGVEAAKLVRSGEQFDVVVLASGAMARLQAEGHIEPDSLKDFARSAIAIAVPKGAKRPNVGTEHEVKQAVRDARRVCYSTGPSGDHLKSLWARWGIAELEAIQAPPGVPVADILARGEANLGFQQLSELLDHPGIDIVGPLPPEIQATTVFSAGVAKTSTIPEHARDFVSHLASPGTNSVKQRCGMEPP